MPLPRGSSSLSLVEPGQPSLQEWVDRSLSEAISEARSRGAQVFHVSNLRIDSELSVGVFDSPVEDAFLFGDQSRVMIGVGAVKVLEPGHSTVTDSRTTRNLLGGGTMPTVDISKVTVMGGWGFPSAPGSREAGAWRDFPSSRWVIPALTLTYEGTEAKLSLAVHVRPSSNVAPLRALYRRLAGALELGATHPPEEAVNDVPLPRLESGRAIPSQKRWLSLAQNAIDSISRDELKKVVLSRAVSLKFRGKVPASIVLKRLIAFNPDSTIFAVKRKGAVFLGATPESLMSVKKGEIEVDCLAASSPRNDDTVMDESLGAHLLEDAKSRREHQLVVQAAVGALSPISSSIEVPDGPVLKRLTMIHHLYTPVKAKLLDGEDIWAAALALWPNPAIGGEPREKAVNWLHKFENLNRGWYSGVVGLMSGRMDEANLVVGIRSGVIKGGRAVIYAGAGLVAGSEPREEFEETGWKLRTMENALGINNSSVASAGW
jgi:isochorismate synthase